MVLGYHVIFGAYGFWLPNDPRGSWSDFVGSWELFRFGPATTIDARHSVAHQPHNQAQRKAAKQVLLYPPVVFSGIQAQAVGTGFGHSFRKAQVVVWACSILPQHVHLIIGRHLCPVEQIVNQLKGNATRQLVLENVHPFGEIRTRNGQVPKCWARGEWKVFLNPSSTLWG